MLWFLLSAFAVFGFLTLIFTIVRFAHRTFTDAAILYPMYRETGDAYFSLRTLSTLCMPLIVITADDTDTTSLQNEFLYADFIPYSEFETFIKQRYQRKDT